MARPDPQALLDAAAALRSQATAGRRAVDEQLQKRDAEIGLQHDRAVQRQQVAEQAVKAAEETRKQETTEAQEFRHAATASENDAVEAEKKGDPNRAEELRESAGRLRARAESADTRAQAADTDTQNAKVELAERERDAHAIDQQMTAMNKESNTAERQLDVMEDKARLLDEAGRKLAAASVTDNVVDRAQLENDAEKLLRDANGIEIDVTGINKFTGGEIKVPDLATQPIDTTAAADPAPSDTATAAADTPTSDTPTTDTATAAADPTDMGTTAPDTTDVVAAATPGTGLPDAFAQVATGAGDASTTLAGTDGDSGIAAPADTSAPVVTADAAPVDDPLGTGTGVGTDSALVGALQTDDITGFADPAPAPAMDVAAADTSLDSGTDPSTPLGDLGTAAPELSPDPVADVDTFATTDSFTTPDDSSADTASTTDDLG